jgi:hypothetical protein
VTLREQEEYTALRATIRERGTARVWAFLFGMTMWAALAIAAAILAVAPVVALLPLVALAATFESVLALHVGAERIGRYLLVFYGDDWERAAGRFGQPAGAIRLDGLFSVPFVVAAFLNLTPLLVTTPIVQELVIVGGAHVLFVTRVLVARARAANQREIDAERFRQLQDDARRSP